MVAVILKTDLCRIEQDQNGYRVLIKMKDGAWVQNAPQSNDLRGLIAALTLSIDVLAGKIWLEGLSTPRAELVEIRRIGGPES